MTLDLRGQAPVKVLKMGDWSAEPVYHKGIPKEVIETSLVWLRDGDHALLSKPGVADFVLTQHRALLMELDAKGAALYEARARIIEQARNINDSLSAAARSTEAYSVGYKMGRYAEIDRMAETIQQIADAGAPQPDAPEPAK